MDSMIRNMSKAFRSERLEYRAFNHDDKYLQAWVLENIASDPVNNAFYMASTPKPCTEKENTEFMGVLAKSILTVCICLAKTPNESQAGTNEGDGREGSSPDYEIIGYMGLREAPHLIQHQGATLGITIAQQYQDKGYGGEAINWLIDWAFKHGNLHRVHISAFSFNERAIALYQKLGFTIEGRERERIILCRKRYDMINMSLLVHEWEELRKKQGLM
ncbi:hypothetical protein NQ176_g3586 [Zarea fungicola]|uniref:Uncharacterized protein n=1 Tax=Zarea fungicola TaxID=93591 RepID=A0ACC1NHT3_9HYPO|nr:hypothetical protein NQ176_g3586 [Lecanicillium fungicola]